MTEENETETSEITFPEEMDERVALLGAEVNKRSELELEVQGDLVVVGSVPNCGIVSVNPETDRVSISFHLDCHPMAVVFVTATALDCLDGPDLEFGGCFLPDVNGNLIGDEDPAFDLMYLQYLRDALKYKEEKSAAFQA